MKNALACALAVSLLIVTATGCADVADTQAATTNGGAENELAAKDFAGSYKMVSDDDAWSYPGNVDVSRQGTKLTLTLDGTAYALTRTKSGAYVFSSGDLNGECDDPGCGWTLKINGVLYQKKVSGKLRPALKLTITEMYEHPEYEGDREGEVQSTFRFAKQ